MISQFNEMRKHEKTIKYTDQVKLAFKSKVVIKYYTAFEHFNQKKKRKERKTSTSQNVSHLECN